MARFSSEEKGVHPYILWRIKRGFTGGEKECIPGESTYTARRNSVRDVLLLGENFSRPEPELAKYIEYYNHKRIKAKIKTY
ncbi:IS3 family transposase [Peribacillus frigoritolerans]|uniref:IS3 family transposase n=1 Tax=Peribacillus frigoritolerans TaxID=450367 RepID=UPI0039A18929